MHTPMWVGSAASAGCSMGWPHTLEIVNVHITAQPLHPEDSLGEIDWEHVRRRSPDSSFVLEDENQLDRVGRLGEMVDEWCPIPEGNPALAEAAGHVYGVLVEAPDLDSHWLLHRLSLDPGGPSWWCRWCPEGERRPAQYVTGAPDGTVSCDSHLHRAAAHEHVLNSEKL